MLDPCASPEQRERFLQPLVAGDVYPSVGLTEPEVAGSDPTLMQTTARLDGAEWVIDGHKWFTTGASRAAFTTVFAKTDPENPKHAQFSSIIVPTDTPGYLPQRAVPTLGHACVPAPARRADHGAGRGAAQRGRLRPRARAAEQPPREARRGFSHQPEA